MFSLDWKAVESSGDSSLSIDKDDPEFVTQLQASLSSEIPKTTQGDVLMEDIEAIKEELVPSEPVYDIILKLHATAVTEVIGFNPGNRRFIIFLI